MLRRVALVRTDVSEELSTSIIRVTRISKLETFAVTSNRRTLRIGELGKLVPSSPIHVTLMMKMLISPKCRLLQEPHGVTSQKAAFFIVTAVKTSNLTQYCS
jgi:hypothetical protein